MIAFIIPLERVPEPFVKKETVIGIIGKTQGVNKATNPQPKPSKKIFQKLTSSFLIFAGTNSSEALTLTSSFSILSSSIFFLTSSGVSTSKASSCFFWLSSFLTCVTTGTISSFFSLNPEIATEPSWSGGKRQPFSSHIWKEY